MGLRAGLDVVDKQKKMYQCLCRGLNPGRPARSLVSVLTELPRLRYWSFHQNIMLFLLRVTKLDEYKCEAAETSLR
jgi:hypothetical protein